ncbi:hypothetical protein E3Q24_00722 [Wallemia mellicola]|uniref:Alpha/beta-hydrolase n=1 Tax=Wallemia mellicola TaxID=1708541 RepID=A0AB74KK74_9BASI|nr:hypothetical protein E3Q24_00722 [Wallemia mellicola]TIC25679.1 alpha/beta-hydrolase [Wallemia mellicola]TIC70663.1 alpha/beta-hydrolase [Wallemia mellicola]
MRVSPSRMFLKTLSGVWNSTPGYIINQILHSDAIFSPRHIPMKNGHAIGDSHAINLHERELLEAEHDNWVTFQTFEKTGRQPNDVDADLLLIHGYADYGGKWVANARKFIARGYRVIAIDLPGHGRSSGLHVFVPSCNVLTQAIASVMKDVHPPNKQVFVMGHSLGGFLAISYALQYPAAEVLTSQDRPKLSGVYALSPMLGISPEVRPPWIIETIARTLASFIGHLPFIKSDGTLKTDDQRIIKETLSDIRVYQGALRIGTGLAFLTGIENINKDVGKLNVPLRICHGDADRVTLCDASILSREIVMSKQIAGSKRPAEESFDEERSSTRIRSDQSDDDRDLEDLARQTEREAFEQPEPPNSSHISMESLAALADCLTSNNLVGLMQQAYAQSGAAPMDPSEMEQLIQRLPVPLQTPSRAPAHPSPLAEQPEFTKKKELLSAEQKRNNHLQCEQKRRSAQKAAFDALATIMADENPNLGATSSSSRSKTRSKSANTSKGVLLSKAVSLIRWLERTNAALKKEIDKWEQSAAMTLIQAASTIKDNNGHSESNQSNSASISALSNQY